MLSPQTGPWLPLPILFSSIFHRPGSAGMQPRCSRPRSMAGVDFSTLTFGQTDMGRVRVTSCPGHKPASKQGVFPGRLLVRVLGIPGYQGLGWSLSTAASPRARTHRSRAELRRVQQRQPWAQQRGGQQEVGIRIPGSHPPACMRARSRTVTVH